MLLRVHLDSTWSAEDFQSLFGALDRLYVFVGLDEARIYYLDKAIRRREDELYQDFHDHRAHDGSPSFAIGLFLGYLERAEGPREFWAALNRPESQFADYHKFSSARQAITLLAQALHTPHFDRDQIRSTWKRSRSDTRRFEIDFLERESLRAIQPLVVKKLSYASPGFGDFAGLGESITAVKEIVLKIIEVATQRGIRKKNEELLHEQVQEARLRNELLRIKAIKKKLDLLEHMGVPNEVSLQLLDEIDPSMTFLARAAACGQITNASMEKDD